MISNLYGVKLYRGMYDGTSAIAPTSTDDSTKGFYVGFRLLVKGDGQDYICSDASVGVAVWEVDAKYDERIEDTLRGISGMVVRYCSKLFTGVTPNYRESVGANFSTNTLTDLSAFFTTQFYVGDSILIMGSKRNDGFYRLVDVEDTILTIEGTFPLDIVDDDSIVIVAVLWPKGLSDIGARMAEYDVFRRNESPGLSQESTGNYSASKETVDMMGTGYPASVVAGIQSYKRPRIAGESGLFLGYSGAF